MAREAEPANADSLELRYRGNRVIPEYAALPGGHPYTGRAFGTVGTADWSGSFKDGVPHGTFLLAWNDIARYALRYENGNFVALEEG